MASEEEIVIILNGMRDQLDDLELALGNVKNSGTFDSIQASALAAKGHVETAIATAKNE